MLVHWKRGKGEPDAAPELLREVTVAVACGNTHSASVTAAGDALTWGSGGFGELGDGELTEERAAPAPVPGLRGGARVVAVSCGFYHTAAVRDDGSVWAWGWGRHGQLGLAPHLHGLLLRLASLLDLALRDSPQRGVSRPLRTFYSGLKRRKKRPFKTRRRQKKQCGVPSKAQFRRLVRRATPSDQNERPRRRFLGLGWALSKTGCVCSVPCILGSPELYTLPLTAALSEQLPGYINFHNPKRER